MKTAVVRVSTGILIAAGLVIAGAATRNTPSVVSTIVQAQDCARHYVAGGDHYPAGHEIEEAERYPIRFISKNLLFIILKFLLQQSVMHLGGQMFLSPMNTKQIIIL